MLRASVRLLASMSKRSYEIPVYADMAVLIKFPIPLSAIGSISLSLSLSLSVENSRRSFRTAAKRSYVRTYACIDIFSFFLIFFSFKEHSVQGSVVQRPPARFIIASSELDVRERVTNRGWNFKRRVRGSNNGVPCDFSSIGVARARGKRRLDLSDKLYKRSATSVMTV